MTPGTAPAVTFPFDRNFQVGILGLMTQRYDFLLTAVDLLEASYFEDKVLVWFFQTVKNYYLKYQQTPTVVPVIENELIKAVKAGVIKPTEMTLYAEVCKQLRVPVNTQDYVIDEVIKFCRRQRGRKVLLEIAPEMDTADNDKWDEMIEKVSSIMGIGANYLDAGTNYFASIAERIQHRNLGDARRTIPIGVHDLDLKIGGGLKDGQMGVWLGGTGRGKSIALCHVGKMAVLYGYKVAHYTLELDEHDVADRYDSTYSQVPIHELNNSPTQILKRVENIHAMHGDALMIKEYPTGGASVNTLRSHLKQLESMGWKPDMIIVDYGDLLKPTTNYQDEYADLGAIFRDLRGLAGEKGSKVPLWTATQANRAGLNAEVIDVEHIGDSLKKAQIADIILALCANREEIEAGIMRIFGAKNRNGPDKFTVTLKTAYDRMTLHDPIAPIPTTANNQAAPPGMPGASKGNRRQPKT